MACRNVHCQYLFRRSGCCRQGGFKISQQAAPCRPDRTGPTEPAASPEWRSSELHYTILWWFYSKLTIRRSSLVDCHQTREKWKKKRRSIELFLCFPVTFLFHIWMLRSSGRLCGSSDDTSVHLPVHWVTKGLVIKQQWWHFQSVHTHICSGSIQILTHKMEMLTYHFPASVLNRCVQKDLVHILNVVPCVLFICVLLNSRGNDAPCASL